MVTGGSRGIGEAICLRLAEAGAHVAIADLDADAAAATAAAVTERHGVECTGHGANVLDRSAVGAVADAAVERWGRLDIWVNNAGIYPAARLIDMTDDEWDQTLDVNLKGTFIGSQEAARRMIAGGNPGVIVNMASISGLRSSRGLRGHYVASKHGVLGLTKSLAVELGGDRIRALAIAPGTIMTPGIMAEADVDPDWTAKIHEMGRGFPLGRLGTADDIARVVLFCASDMSMFMTGSAVLAEAGGDAVM
ncbi:MAG: NAD(P)-dependent dehydrogenase (short-subunit alcohol dehydrogenase family) [Ilumatobacter sp.]